MNFISCFIKYADAALLLPQFLIEKKSTKQLRLDLHEAKRIQRISISGTVESSQFTNTG